ncbi:MAG: integration host factor subunit alpha [Nitrospirae bacterium]|nr:integration host factor subunit alpha [Nitrospirota bacterium]
MTKAEIAKAINENVGLPKKEAEDIVETIISLMKDTLSQGENIKIPRFGAFHVRKKRSRIGRNPQTGVDIEITPRIVVKFHPSNTLKKSIE